MVKKEDNVGPSGVIKVESDDDEADAELDSEDEAILQLWNHVGNEDDDE